MQEFSVARQFSRAAASYQLEADLQRRIALSVCSLVPSGIRPAAVLDIGCGTGFLTKAILDEFPSAKVVAIDIAEGMLAEAEAQLGPRETLSLRVADGSALDEENRYDLVVSSSALHWMQPLERTLDGIRRALQKGGMCCFSLMLDGTLPELHELRSSGQGPGPAGMSLPTEGAVSAAAKGAGFEIEFEESSEHVLWHVDSRTALRYLKRIGVTGGSVSMGARRFRPTELKELEAAYQQGYFKEGKGVPMTFRSGLYRMREAR